MKQFSGVSRPGDGIWSEAKRKPTILGKKPVQRFHFHGRSISPWQSPPAQALRDLRSRAETVLQLQFRGQMLHQLVGSLSPFNHRRVKVILWMDEILH